MRATLELLGQLYDGVLKPERFPDAVNSTIAYLRVRGLFFAGFDPTSGPRFQFLEGVPPPLRQLFLGQFLMPDRNPFARTGFGRPPLELVTTDMVAAQTDLENTDFYRELMVPSGLHEYLGTIVVADPDLIAPISLFRGRLDPRFGPEDHERLRVLLPHYQRAAQLLVRFGSLTSEKQAGRSVLDRLPYGVFLLDDSGRLTSCNRMGEEILAAADGLSLHDGKLRAARPEDDAALERMVADAALTGSRRGVGSGGALALSRTTDGPRYELVVAPCGTDPALAVTRRTAVVVFVTDRDRSLALQPHMLQRLYGLTPAEAQVALAIATGKQPAAVADQLGVSLNTVRTHLYRAFEKTGTRRQAELVRLIAGSPLSLDQEQGPPRADGDGT